jgi:hypothetical protein
MYVCMFVNMCKYGSLDCVRYHLKRTLTICAPLFLSLSLSPFNTLSPSIYQMRVWKQLCSHNLSPSVSFKMTALEEDLRLRLSKVNTEHKSFALDT